jgi:hypothetical protein
MWLSRQLWGYRPIGAFHKCGYLVVLNSPTHINSMSPDKAATASLSSPPETSLHNTVPSGLTSDVATSRLQKDGPNAMPDTSVHPLRNMPMLMRCRGVRSLLYCSHRSSRRYRLLCPQPSPLRQRSERARWPNRASFRRGCQPLMRRQR